MRIVAMLLTLQAADWPWKGLNYPSGVHAFQADRPVVVDGRWNGTPTRVQLTQGFVPRCDASGASSWLNGAAADRQDRCTRLTRLDVTVGGRTLPIAAKGYSDLGGVFNIIVRFTPARINIYVQGPAGSDYYEATLRVQRDGTVLRQVYQGIDGSLERKTFAPVRPSAANRKGR